MKNYKYILAVKAIEEKAPEDVKQKLYNQEINVNQAYNEVKKDGIPIKLRYPSYL